MRGMPRRSALPRSKSGGEGLQSACYGRRVRPNPSLERRPHEAWRPWPAAGSQAHSRLPAKRHASRIAAARTLGAESSPMKYAYYSLVACALLSACATPYRAPENSEVATIVFAAPAAEMFGLGHNASVVSGAECSNPTTMAGFHPLSEARTSSKSIQAGSRQFLKASLSNSRSYPQLKFCINLVSFVPVTGAKYTFRQRFAGEACLVELLDESTQRPPSTLQIHDAKPCR